MIRGEIRAKLTCFACFSCLLLHLLPSPGVGKVSKPRRGHPLVEFVIVVWIDGKREDEKSSLTVLCITVHAYGALKGRPRVLRTVQPLFRLPRVSTPRSIKERLEFLKIACV